MWAWASLLNPKGKYDASKYKGISFWAKGPGKVRFKTPDVNTAPEGDKCSDCYNDFGVDLYIAEQWQRYTIPFDRMPSSPTGAIAHPKSRRMRSSQCSGSSRRQVPTTTSGSMTSSSSAASDDGDRASSNPAVVRRHGVRCDGRWLRR